MLAKDRAVNTLPTYSITRGPEELPTRPLQWRRRHREAPALGQLGDQEQVARQEQGKSKSF